MGAAAAVLAAEELAHRVQGYILESPYQNLKVAVRNRIKNVLPRVLDWIAYLGLRAVSPLVLPHLAKISPIRAVAAIPSDVPVLILAGAEDPVARPEEARAIYDRVRSHGKLIVFERCGHMNFPETCLEAYQRSVLGFVDEIKREPA
jgi:alpha-beta hydrolase superfamily lysophospholipase